MPSQKPLIFEQLKTFERRGAEATPSPSSEGIFRASVPEGWLILLKADQPSLFFLPDLNHVWDGGSAD